MSTEREIWHEPGLVGLVGLVGFGRLRLVIVCGEACVRACVRAPTHPVWPGQSALEPISIRRFISGFQPPGRR